MNFKFISILLGAAVAFAATTKFQTDNLQFGKPASGNKSFIFNRSTGSTNPTIKWNEGTSTLQFSNDGTSFSDIPSSAISNMPLALINIGINASVSSNQLTIRMTQADGSTNCSAGSSCKLSFRTSAGAFTQITQAATGPSITAPSGATLGQTSGVNQYVWVYAVNHSGSLTMCVIGVEPLNDNELLTGATTSITSGSTSGSTMYCGGSFSVGDASRLIGRVLVNEPTAGTWNTSPSDITVGPRLIRNQTAWAVNGLTITGTTTNPTVGGSPSPNRQFWRRDGRDMLVRIEYKQTSSGTAGSGDYLFNVPNSQSIDSTLLTMYSTVTGWNLFVHPTNVLGTVYGATTSGSGFFMGVVSAFDATHVRFSANSNTAQSGSIGSNASAFPLSLGDVSYAAEYRAPIVGWSEYGP